MAQVTHFFVPFSSSLLLFLGEEAGTSQLTKMCFNRMRSWSLSNRQVGKNENANYLRESVGNESADWVTRQPVGPGVFLFLGVFFSQDNDLFWGISAVHTQQK